MSVKVVFKANELRGVEGKMNEGVGIVFWKKFYPDVDIIENSFASIKRNENLLKLLLFKYLCKTNIYFLIISL